MRDGIPRGLPVPKLWQSYVECADRPADRGTDRPMACMRDAIQDELRREFSPVRNELSKIVTNAESYLPGFEVAGLAVADTVLDKHHLADIAREVRGNVEGGSDPRAALLDAVTGRLEERTAAHRRQIVENLAGKISPGELKRFTDKFDNDVAKVDFRSEAARFLDTSTPRQSAKTLIAADEDLRGGS
jgi:hypothetical protein